MFIVLAGALALVTALALALPFLRSRAAAESRAAYDAQAYRAQLREVDQDVSRGVLTEAEAQAARIEISRRLLSATDAIEAEGESPAAPRDLRMGLGIGAAIGIPVVAAALYLGIGGAGQPDMPLDTRTDFASQMAQRPSQKRAEAILQRSGYTPDAMPLDTPELQRVVGMIEQVEAVLERKPDDATGRLILARTQTQIGRYREASRNYELLLTTATQPDLDLYGDAIEAMVQATSGYVSPEAEAIADRGAKLDPTNARFRHYKALALSQNGKVDEALIRWADLLDDAEPSDPWVDMVYDYASEAADNLGVPPPPRPDGERGPSREDMAAAAAMPAEDRNAMIEGMVANLAERLAEDPDDLQGWLRLIRAYTVLDRPEQRDKAIGMARNTFAGDTEALERIDAAGQ